MKKIVVSLCSVFLLIGLTVGISMTAQAGSTYESENNDSYSTADRIILGDSMTGALSSGDDCDYYKITPASNGKISIRFKHIYEDSDNGEWYITVFMYSNGAYKELSSTTVGLNGNENVALPYIGAVKDGIYYVKVETKNWGDDVSGRKYTLSTSFTQSDYYEKEVNNSYASATKMNLGHSYQGVINSNDDDVDFYKVIPSQNGKISISFKHVYEDRGGEWNISVYRYCSGAYVELSSTNVSLNGNESVALPYIGAVKNGVYYVKVCRNNYYYWEDVSGRNYVLKTGFTASEYYEKEPNDTYETATKVSLNHSYSGNMNNGDDTDVYKIVAPMKGKLNITFNHRYEDSYDAWKVYIYKYANGAYTELNNTVISVNSSSKLTLPAITTVKDGIYYVKVCRNNYSNVVGRNYDLGMNFNCFATTSFRVSSRTATSLKLVWSKVSDASGYQLQRKSGSNYKDVAKTTSLSRNITGLKAGTRYTFRIRAYKTVNGKTYYSSWKTLTTPTKPGTPTLKVTAGTGKASLSWNKQTGASGYVVYMSTSKNGKYTKVATLKGNSKVTFTKTGLTKGRYYYFKTAAYITSNGEMIYGSFSPVKSVKIK